MTNIYRSYPVMVALGQPSKSVARKDLASDLNLDATRRRISTAGDSTPKCWLNGPETGVNT